FSGIFMGCSIISKYTALLVIPLTGTWWIFRLKKLSRPWLAVVAWVIGLGFLVAYSAVTAKLYGSPHIIAASTRMVHTCGWIKILASLVFFWGVSRLPLVAGFTGGPRRALWTFPILVSAIALFASKAGGFTLTQSILMGLWLVTSGLFLANFL